MYAGISGDVRIRTESVELAGTLHVPAGARGLVVFADGGSRFSARDRAVASHLAAAGLSTLQLDLLSEEERRYEGRFNLDRLTRRLVEAARWSTRQPALAAAPMGLFGSGTGAAAVLRAALLLGPRVHAIVSHGGRPDLAAAALPFVRAPTLFIVGGADPELLARNRKAKALLPRDTVATIEVIAGTHNMSDETVAPPRAAELAAAWFRAYLQDHPERARAVALS